MEAQELRKELVDTARSVDAAEFALNPNGSACVLHLLSGLQCGALKEYHPAETK